MPQSKQKHGSGPRIVECSDWAKITHEFDSLPAPSISFHPDDDPHGPTWIFRGLKSDNYGLEPTIEREAGEYGAPWSALEPLLISEFQSKARMYTNPLDLPPRDEKEKLSWLALMQHYGVPTRLLDFTYSHYAALYFALRKRSEPERKSEYVRVWAIDGEAVMKAALIERHAALKQAQKEGPLVGKTVLFFAVPTEKSVSIAQGLRHAAISGGLGATPLGQSLHYERSGLVYFALPPIQNLRLSNQQGVFLLNCADGLTFRDSLVKMMKQYDDSWCRLIPDTCGFVARDREKAFSHEHPRTDAVSRSDGTCWLLGSEDPVALDA